MGNDNDKRLEKSKYNKSHSQNLYKTKLQYSKTLKKEEPKSSKNDTLDMSEWMIWGAEEEGKSNATIPKKKEEKQIVKENNNPPPKPALNRSMTTAPKKNLVTLKMLKDAFKTYCIDNDYLNRPRFNDAIESIFRFNIPEMHYTYLSDKIYDLMDSSGDGKIQEDEFLDGFGKVLKDRNFRLLLSMMAMMSLPDKTRDYIEIDEIKDFFYNSFVQGYKHLGWQIRKNPEEFKKSGLPIATIEQLGKWAEKFEREVKASIEKEIRGFLPNIQNSMTFDDFMRWIGVDHTIYIQYGNRTVAIATSLIRLDDISYDEGSAGDPNFKPYPII